MMRWGGVKYLAYIRARFAGGMSGSPSGEGEAVKPVVRSADKDPPETKSSIEREEQTWQRW